MIVLEKRQVYCKRNIKTSSVFTIETLLLCILPFSLLVPSELGSITPWTAISPVILLRAGLWLFVLCLFPGLYVLRITKLAKNISNIARIVLAVNLSIIIVAVMTLVCYFARISLSFFPWLFLSVLGFLHPIWWFKVNETQESPKAELPRSIVFLIIGMAVAIIIAFCVQLAQKYLVPGDVWVSLKPAVEMISNRDVFELFSVTQYPLMFGVILAGLSACTGLPVVNTYVLLFPLVALNLTSFFILLKSVFQFNDKVSTISTILYAFGGGLAWLFQVMIFQGAGSMWSLNFFSQDIYFSMAFWNTQEFSHRTLALTLSYSSTIAFFLSTKFADRFREMIALTLSSLFMLFSFYVHMVEPLIFIPLILLIAIVRKTGRSRYFSLSFFALMIVLIALPLDFFMSGYYIWLSLLKVSKFFFSGDMINYWLYLFVACVGILIIAVLKRFGFEKLKLLITRSHSFSRKKYRLLFAIVLSGIYVLGLLFLTPFSWWNMSPFPWYMYVARYGFVGILALIGFAIADWSWTWFKIASLWGLFVLVMGSLWWGSRINAYMFPVLALFAGFGVYIVWQKANVSLQIAVVSAKTANRWFRVNLKPVISLFLIITLLLSFSTIIYGSVYHSFSSISLTDDEALALSDINHVTSEDATILVPDIYNIREGVKTIGDRNVYLLNQLPTISNGQSFFNLTNILSSNNIRYLIKTADTQKSGSLDWLVSYSGPLFQYGTLSAYTLPPFSPPSTNEGAVAVYDRELQGFFGNVTNFGWIDDSFIEGWSQSNIDARSDGEILNFSWTFNSTDKREPIMKTKFSPVNTDKYPFLIVRYRNTVETSSFAQDTVRQIVTLVNEEGYPQGFIENHYLPLSIDENYQIYIQKLPANISVAETWIWMRNYGGKNGTADLEIDYIGFSSSEFTTESSVDLRLLSMALPSLWPQNYFITSDLNETKNATYFISTYSENVFNYLKNTANAEVFIFITQTAIYPSWGVEWSTSKEGIISGFFNGKKVIILGADFLQHDNIILLAQLTYAEAKSYT
jgi:hypothetical protein